MQPVYLFIYLFFVDKSDLNGHSCPVQSLPPIPWK